VYDLNQLGESEIKTLKALEKLGGKATVEEIVEESKLAHAAVARSILTLRDGNFIKVSEKSIEIITLSSEGLIYASEGMPERKLLNALIRLGGEASIDQIVEEADLTKESLKIALGWAKGKGWIKIGKGKIKALTEKPQVSVDEKLLDYLVRKKTISADKLPKELKDAIPILKRRGLIEISERVIRELKLTEKGKSVLKLEVVKEVTGEVSQLTPELIVSGKWRKVKFRKFNVSAPGPTIYPGRIHPLQQIIEEIREIFLEMGFTEIRGPIVELAFWNFDALFVPQDHPARDMWDTFYLLKPNVGDLPNEGIVSAVADAHEFGGETGSKGWRYKWSWSEASKLILRTHTTSVTIRYLAEHKKPPVWVFSVDRVYRNERVDYKHLAEFYQIEGIIMDEDVSLRDLIGILTEFYRKLGLEKVKFRPSYFPFTEPSAESIVYVPELNAWIELCGMGMFRPEVLKPLGIEYPVLAWGGGLERLAMLRLGLKDIRILYRNNLGWLRRVPICL